jgi:hypothetical protein
MITMGNGTRAVLDTMELPAPVYFPVNYMQRMGPRKHLLYVPSDAQREVSVVIDVASREVRVWTWLHPEDIRRPQSADDS